MVKMMFKKTFDVFTETLSTAFMPTKPADLALSSRNRNNLYLKRAVRIVTVALTLAVLIIPSARGQEGEKEKSPEAHYSLSNRQPLTGRITTGRPSFGTGTSAVPIGRFQFELGYTYLDGPGGRNDDVHTIPNILIRFGVLDTIELRLFSVGYISREGGEDGFDGFRLGSKIEIMGQRGVVPKMAVQPSFRIPMKDASNSDGLDPLLQVAASWDLGAAWNMLMNFNFGAVSDEEKDTETVFAYSVLIGRSLTHRLSVFAEYFARVPPGLHGDTERRFRRYLPAERQPPARYDRGIRSHRRLQRHVLRNGRLIPVLSYSPDKLHSPTSR
jgi:hypothetical protein